MTHTFTLRKKQSQLIIHCHDSHKCENQTATQTVKYRSAFWLNEIDSKCCPNILWEKLKPL